jgi:hypothetical protein
MPLNKQIGRVSASECVCRRPQSPLARGNGELPLPKPVNSAILAAKPPESGECRLSRADSSCLCTRHVSYGRQCHTKPGVVGKSLSHRPGLLSSRPVPLYPARQETADLRRGAMSAGWPAVVIEL